jgi:hypothetical protein
VKKAILISCVVFFVMVSLAMGNGPVAHWKLDGDGVDSAGSNDGVVYGALTVDGVIDDALEFDGADDYIYIGDKLNAVDIPFSISCWIYKNRDAKMGIFCSDNSSSGNYYGFQFGIESNQTLFVMYGDGSDDGEFSRRSKLSDCVIENNRWYFVAAVVRGPTDIDLYIDGVNEGGLYGGSGGDMVHNQYNAVIGLISKWGPYYFDGLIDDLVIYDRDLSASEITARYETGLADTNGPAAHWKLDGDGVDSVGGNDGVVYGALTVDGVIDEGLEFDGVDDYVEGMDSPFDFEDTTFTVSLWFRETLSNGVLISEGGVLGGWFIGNGTGTNPEGIQVNLKRDGSSGYTAYEACTTESFNDGRWHHVVAVITTSTSSAQDNHADIYVDGILESVSELKVYPYGASSNFWQIGARPDRTDRFGGKIDDVMIYDRGLGVDEITTIYEAGLAEIEGPIAHWKLDGDGVDSVGGNDGVVYGALTVGGVINDALEFDGVDDYVSTTYEGGPGEYSVSLWYKLGEDFYTSHSDTYRTLLSKKGDEAYLVELWCLWFNAYNGGLMLQNEKAQSNYAMVSYSPPVFYKDEWHHVVVTADSTEGKIYFDGELKNTVNDDFVTGAWDDSVPVNIGTPYLLSNDRYFNGSIDDVRIYGRALSAQEIAAIYEAAFDTYHVDGVSGDDGNDGLSRDGAFATIQCGIEACEDGDTVLVWPGVYNEVLTNGINFKGKAITVKSAADAAVLEVPGQTAVTFVQGENAGSVLSNFVIKGSEKAMFIMSSSPTINNVTVVDNQNGMICDSGEPDISNCIFWNNANGDLYGCEAENSFTQSELENRLVAYWKLDGDGVDSIGGNDGIVYGAATVDGVIDDALEFDGVDDYVEGTDSPFDFEDMTFTVSLWLRKTLDRGVFISEGSFLGGWQIADGVSTNSGGIKVMLKRGGSSGLDAYEAVTTEDYNDGRWHHITAVITTSTASAQGNHADIFIDGALVSVTERNIYPYGAANDNWRIGASIASNFCGDAVDDVMIYDRGLSAGEIGAMYNAGLVGHNYIEYDPGFVDVNGGDYHLLSERGRYDALCDKWVLDDVTSVCVDAGDPNVEPVDERMPNGGRINMGAYGGTAFASMSEWVLQADLNRDGVVDFCDFAMFGASWLSSEEWKQ